MPFYEVPMGKTMGPDTYLVNASAGLLAISVPSDRQKIWTNMSRNDKEYGVSGKDPVPQLKDG